MVRVDRQYLFVNIFKIFIETTSMLMVLMVIVTNYWPTGKTSLPLILKLSGRRTLRPTRP